MTTARLERAIQLKATELECGRYLVTGGAQPHIVDMREEPGLCDCRDFGFRSAECKHLLCVRLIRGDGDLLEELGQLVRRLAAAVRGVGRAIREGEPR